LDKSVCFGTYTYTEQWTELSILAHKCLTYYILHTYLIHGAEFFLRS